MVWHAVSALCHTSDLQEALLTLRVRQLPKPHPRRAHFAKGVRTDASTMTARLTCSLCIVSSMLCTHTMGQQAQPVNPLDMNNALFTQLQNC